MNVPTEGEWRAHQAFYEHTVKQRDAAWREIEALKSEFRPDWATDEAKAVLDAAVAFINCAPADRPPLWKPLALAADAYIASQDGTP